MTSVAGGTGEAHNPEVEIVEAPSLPETDEEKVVRIAAETLATNVREAIEEVDRLARKVDKETLYLEQAQDALAAAKANLAELQGA